MKEEKEQLFTKEIEGLEQDERIKKVRSTKHSNILCEGLYGSSLSLFLSALYGISSKQKEKESIPSVVLMKDEETAAYLYNDLLQFLGEEEVLFFPSSYRRHIKYGHIDLASKITRSEVISFLSESKQPIIISYPLAIAERIPDEKVLSEHTLSLSVGQIFDQKKLRQELLEWGFELKDYVYEAGEMAFRGSIVDIFSFNSEYPYRIDFFDNEIDTISSFSPESQSSIEKLKEITIMPNFSTFVSENNRSLLSLVPKNYRLCIEDLNSLFYDIEQLWNAQAFQVEGDKNQFLSSEEMYAQLVPVENIKHEIKELRKIYLQKNGLEPKIHSIPFQIRPQALFHKNFDLLIQALEDYKEENNRVWFLSQKEQQYQRLKQILTDLNREELCPHYLPITLHEGFEDTISKQIFLSDHQIFERFHQYQLKSDRIRQSKVNISIKDVKNFNRGDYLVHYDHGIGRFAGLISTKNSDGTTEEVLKIDYLDNAYILVKLHSLHKLSKYRAKDEVQPKISSLKGGTWSRLKENTKKKIKSMARDLIALYAARKEAQGFAFSADSYLQHELEASFIYEETPDQVKAIESVKTDMEDSKPMDRLLCGDVGFGKTEIAIRAAFKAVNDNKQVAVLVPTTLLAYQHYHTFQKRLQDLPVRIAYFSRAISSKESKQIIEELKEGKIDIIIGTHKLVGKSIAFKDLGLLIIDEEQKFGVKVKEALRKLQVSVDTLSMSATPIPRTLQFSLMGTRDLSNIITPPKNRYPIATEIIPFSKELIAEAINYELSRNGQVFFVHNEIIDIEKVADELRKIVPQSRIAIAHGRLQAPEMEQLLLDFAQHEYDILVSTTIIENGIDISNANTIIIDKAHRYGLSALHQLRGRVGRSERKAFCYLIVPDINLCTSDAKRRLQAITSYSDLGSGLRIAMQDLDIRGAGNIFGKEQSGYISDLGLETYQKVFEEAVQEVKYEEFANLFDKKEQVKKDVLFETDLALSFPPEYIPLDSERIDIYRRLNTLQSFEEMEQFCLYLKDRFGQIPKEGRELLYVPLLRQQAAQLQLEKLTLAQKTLRLYLPSDNKSPFYDSEGYQLIIQYIAKNSKTSFIKEDRKGQRIVGLKNIERVQDALEKLCLISGENCIKLSFDAP